MASIYKLRPQEFIKYQQHLLSLDAESKYMRFGFHASDAKITELVNAWQDNSKEHVIFVIENSELEVIAVGHISTELPQVEIALSVLKQYQGKGLGSSLMSKCVAWCQNRGVKSVGMVCLPQNYAVKKIAKQHGLVVTENGESAAILNVPDMNTLSVLDEYFSDRISLLDHLAKSQIMVMNRLRSQFK